MKKKQLKIMHLNRAHLTDKYSLPRGGRIPKQDKKNQIFIYYEIR